MHIDYDDGEKEVGVSERLVRSGGGGGGGSPRRDDSRSDNPKFEEGDKIEGLYRGRGSKWYSGTITRVNRDGTYDIRYDDGDSEDGGCEDCVLVHAVPPWAVMFRTVEA